MHLLFDLNPFDPFDLNPFVTSNTSRYDLIFGYFDKIGPCITEETNIVLSSLQYTYRFHKEERYNSRTSKSPKSRQ